MACGACPAGSLTPSTPPSPSPTDNGQGRTTLAPTAAPTAVVPRGRGSQQNSDGSVSLNTIIRDFSQQLNSDFEYTFGSDPGIVMCAASFISLKTSHALLLSNLAGWLVAVPCGQQVDSLSTLKQIPSQRKACSADVGSPAQ